jgi:hypothetical protein
MEETQKPMDADPKQVRVCLFPCLAGLVRCQGMLGTEVSRKHYSIALASFVYFLRLFTPRRSLILVEGGYNLCLKQTFPPLMVLTVLTASSLSALAI